MNGRQLSAINIMIGDGIQITNDEHYARIPNED